MQKKILLTTVHKPLGVESETCTKNILAEMYHAQITLTQGPFSIRAVCTGWGLDFIGINMTIPTTVLHYPSMCEIKRELKKEYEYFGIGFSICTFPKTLEIIKIAREIAPKTKIILGGYGTVLQECDQYADLVCREEGVNFFKKLLGEPETNNFKIPAIKRKLKVLSISSSPEYIIPVGLGCSRGCDFCCTSHYFDRNYYPLIKDGKAIHDFICSLDYGNASYRDLGIIDEDFLMDYERGLELVKYNSQEIEKPILFSCLTSLKSLKQYSIDELLSMGLAGAWVGIESKNAKYNKLKSINPPEIMEELKSNGIAVLTSMIFGFDWHTPDEIEKDFQYLLSLKPTLSQLMLYSPCPQTPLFDRMKQENRLLDIPYKLYDGLHLLFSHPHYSPEDMEKLIFRLIERENEELGPCIFRVLEIQLNGYEKLKESENPLFKRRSEEIGRENVRTEVTEYDLI